MTERTRSALDTLHDSSLRIAEFAEARQAEGKHTPEPWAAVATLADNTVGVIGSYSSLSDAFTLSVPGTGVTLFHSSDRFRVLAWLQGFQHSKPAARLAVLERVAEIVIELRKRNLIIGRLGSRHFRLADDLDAALAALDTEGDALKETQRAAMLDGSMDTLIKRDPYGDEYRPTEWDEQ